jgi:hypothetical protein
VDGVGFRRLKSDLIGREDETASRKTALACLKDMSRFRSELRLCQSLCQMISSDALEAKMLLFPSGIETICTTIGTMISEQHELLNDSGKASALKL